VLLSTYEASSQRGDALKCPLRWHFEHAWVNKIEGPSPKASGNEITVETLEIAHEGLTTESIKN
jgi:phage tail-like protein